MICPWLVKTVVQTNNKNSYNDSVRTEHQEFDRCMKHDCPFFFSLRKRAGTSDSQAIETCQRVEIEKAKHLSLK